MSELLNLPVRQLYELKRNVFRNQVSTFELKHCLFTDLLIHFAQVQPASVQHLMLQQTYFDLISESNLPPTAYFVDPSDELQTAPEPKETLNKFITRLSEGREQRGLPLIAVPDLRQLIVDSFYNSTPINQRPTYFNQQSISPTLSQAYSFIKATANTLINRVGIPPLQRTSRANHCLNNCKFHSKSRNWGGQAAAPMLKTAKSLVGLQEATVSPSETQLGNCMLCGGCDLKTKVAYSLESVLASLTPEQVDLMLRAYGPKTFEQCWIFEEALKDPPNRQLLRQKIAVLRSNSPWITQALQRIQKES